MINQLDRATCKRLGAKMEAAIKAVLASEGLSVAYAGGSFDSATFKPKFLIKVLPTDGRSVEQADFERSAPAFGLTAADWKKRFTSGPIATEYFLCGLRPGSHRYPVIGMNRAGKKYKFGLSVLLQLRTAPRPTRSNNLLENTALTESMARGQAFGTGGTDDRGEI